MTLPVARAIAGPPPSVVARRRWIFALLVLVTGTGLIILMGLALGGGGFGLLDAVMLALFALTVPWTVVGFWNACFGLALMWLHRTPLAAVAPFAVATPASPIHSRFALLACLRNEDTAPLAPALAAMLDELDAAGVASLVHLFLLSDTSIAEIAQAEERIAAALEERYRGRIAVTYRRRPENIGFKAGNIRDFCLRWGARFDLAIVLDADSVMSAATMLRAVRLMEANPGIGILQTLATGMPTGSGFARLFQFGMRLGMRSYTLGASWWQADCGPYWGHNAVLRLAPFIAHCALPDLPGRPPLGGPILSHDQVEAALMRRAGFEVRVFPEEQESFERNPPTLLEFIRRDLRWCQGNMQYWRLLALSSLRMMSRIQLGLAIQMYLAAPGWLLFLILGMTRATVPGLPPVHMNVTLGKLLFILLLAMTFAPKLATALDVLAHGELRRAFGGGLRFGANLAAELIFSALLAPILAVAQTLFILGLPLGRMIGWDAQKRSDHAVSLKDGLRRLWPQTLFGLGTAALAWHGGYFLSALPFTLGLMLAVPFAMLTASGGFGRLALRLGLGRIPEETTPPAILQRIGVPGRERS